MGQLWGRIHFSIFMSLSTLTRITTTLTMFFLASCATYIESIELTQSWKSSYRNCPISGQAYFHAIPLASRNEHEQAELFEPIDSSNCLIYVVRSDSQGSKSADAYVFLYHPGQEPPPLPPDYWPLFGLNSLYHPRWHERYTQETSRELRKAEIYSRDVYAVWELAPGSYVLDASTDSGHPFARAAITCTAGRATFWAVKAKYWMTEIATLNELDEAEGKALVLHRLRSAGMQYGGPNSPGWISERKCPTE